MLRHSLRDLLRNGSRTLASLASGGTATVTLRVTNLAGLPATGVVVRDEVPVPLQSATGLTAIDSFFVRSADASAAGVARAAAAIRAGPGRAGSLRVVTTAN
ncbi:MAG TPA: hypothetical protein VIC57_19320, partial [Candidatus Dormibacteraeota bacterium]